MNKIININLGGYPFAIDEDAFDYLKKYLDAIHKHFKKSEGYEEITGDIETRLAELFQEQMKGRAIVNNEDVAHAIKVMGSPQEFGAEAVFESEPQQEKRSKTREHYEFSRPRTGKRLFRNPDDKVLAGVCSGISAYFGIADPIWVRLLFVVITIAGGFGIPAYFILWAIVPKAISASDRLSMKGEPVNISNIAKVIEEEAQNLSDKITELTEEMSQKKKER